MAKLSKTDKILQYRTRKDRKVTFMFNNELWELFKKYCGKNESKPTWEFEKLMLNILDKEGMLDE